MKQTKLWQKMPWPTFPNNILYPEVLVLKRVRIATNQFKSEIYFITKRHLTVPTQTYLIFFICRKMKYCKEQHMNKNTKIYK